MLAAFRLQLRLNLVSPNYLSAVFFQPLLLSMTACIVFKTYGRTDYLPYAVIGAGIFGTLNANLYAAAGVINGERRFGTLEFLLTTQSPFILIALGKTMAIASFSLLALVISGATAVTVFELPMYIEHPLALAMSLILCMSSLIALSLELSTLFFVVKHYYRVNDFFYLVFILSGLLFPATTLPGPLRLLSRLLPTTWTTESLRMAMAGVSWDAFVQHSFSAFALIAVHFAAATKLCNLAVNVGRSQSRLGRT
jgi:ABC-2 type transport system permease protein